MAKKKNFNPRTPCGVRLPVCRLVINDPLISIHALHAECDFNVKRIFHGLVYFNPRTPCGVRPTIVNRVVTHRFISIHALHAECDFAAA